MMLIGKTANWLLRHSVQRCVKNRRLVCAHATFALRMRRNGYLCITGVNLDTAVRFAVPDFLLECKISAIWRCFTLIFSFNILNVRHISTSGLFDLLTYKVYHTRRPHVDNSHQVWSWYDHTLSSYSVFVCWYITWLCDLDFWPFDLEQLLCMVGHVANLATKFEDPMPIRSWVMSYNVSVDYHWKCVRFYCACAESRDTPVGGQKQLHFWNLRPWFTYSLCTFGGSTMNVINVICENNARPCVKNVWDSAHARNHVIC